MIGFVGDVHGRYEPCLRYILEHPEVEAWVQVGDLGEVGKPYPDLPENFLFIQGNHEEWSLVKNHPSYIPNGTIRTIARKKIACLGGNYSSKYYDYAEHELKQSRARHYVREQVDRLLRDRLKGVDILVTHEAPSPYMRRGKDAGQVHVTKLLTEMRPDIHFFGHHHYFGVYDYDGLVSVGLEYGHRSLVLYRPEDNKIEKVELS